MLRIRRRDERGVALIASLLVMLICVVIVAAALQLADHTIQRSGLDRSRTASRHAAEAGIQTALADLSATNACPSPGSEVQLPDQNLPQESYKIVSLTCPTSDTAIVTAVGYVPNAAKPVATTTLVAHIDRGQGAPVSGPPSRGGYVFPDAVFSGGAITTAGAFNTYGYGGTVPNVVANGAITVSGSQLDGLVHGWGLVNLTASQVGGDIIGTDVTVNNATVQGSVASAGPLSLNSATVNGNAIYSSGSGPSGSTVTGSTIHQSPAFQLPNKRLMPVFTDTPGDVQSLLGVGAPSSSCPLTGTGTFYDVPINGICNYNPATIDGTVVVVVHGGVLNVTVPQTNNGGQLYLIAAGGTINLAGTNSTLPVFAYADGLLGVAMNGAFVGQVVGSVVTTTGATTMTFRPPSVPAPDFAFQSSQVAPTAGALGNAAHVAFEYRCPGVVFC